MAKMLQPNDIFEKRRSYLIEALDLNSTILGEKLVEYQLMSKTQLTNLKAVVKPIEQNRECVEMLDRRLANEEDVELFLKALSESGHEYICDELHKQGIVTAKAYFKRKLNDTEDNEPDDISAKRKKEIHECELELMKALKQKLVNIKTEKGEEEERTMNTIKGLSAVHAVLLDAKSSNSILLTLKFVSACHLKALKDSLNALEEAMLTDLLQLPGCQCFDLTDVLIETNVSEDVYLECERNLRKANREGVEDMFEELYQKEENMRREMGEMLKSKKDLERLHKEQKQYILKISELEKVVASLKSSVQVETSRLRHEYSTWRVHPTMDLDVKEVNPLVNDVRGVTSLPDGGCLFQNYTQQNQHQISYIDSNGQTVPPCGTCESEITAIIESQGVVYALEKTGTITERSLSDLSTVLHTYMVDVGYMCEGDMLDSDRLIITDPDLDEVFTLNLKNNDKQVHITGLVMPVSVACRRDSRIFAVTESIAHQVSLYDYSFNLINIIGSPGKGDGQLYYPECSIFTPWGTLLVANSENDRISEFSLNGGHFIGHVHNDNILGPEYISYTHPHLWVAGYGQLKRFKIFTS